MEKEKDQKPLLNYKAFLVRESGKDREEEKQEPKKLFTFEQILAEISVERDL